MARLKGDSTHEVQGHWVVETVVDGRVGDTGICVDALVSTELTVVDGHDDSSSW